MFGQGGPVKVFVATGADGSRRGTHATPPVSERITPEFRPAPHKGAG